MSSPYFCRYTWCLQTFSPVGTGQSFGRQVAAKSTVKRDGALTHIAAKKGPSFCWYMRKSPAAAETNRKSLQSLVEPIDLRQTLPRKQGLIPKVTFAVVLPTAGSTTSQPSLLVKIPPLDATSA